MLMEKSIFECVRPLYWFAIVPLGCSIWDHQSTGSMAESRGGRGNAVLTRFRLHRPATEPSVYGQIPRDVTDVTTCLWPPPLESEASEVASCHPHSRSFQSGGQRAVSSCTSWGVETLSPGNPADLESVQSCSCRPVCISINRPLPVVLLPIRGNARHGLCSHWHTAGPRVYANMHSPSEPTSTDTVQDQGGWGAGPVSGSILAQQDLVPGNHAPHDSPSLADSAEEGSAFSETGHPLAPTSRLVEIPCVVPGQDAAVLGDLPQEVGLTIASTRATSTRWIYALKWNLFIEWCSSHHDDPWRCSIRRVLCFLQARVGA